MAWRESIGLAALVALACPSTGEAAAGFARGAVALPQVSSVTSVSLRLVDERWLVVASRETAGEAMGVAQSYGDLLGGAAVVSSSNGRFAIVAGTLLVDKARSNLETLKALRLIPQDSFLSDGKALHEVYWSSFDSSRIELMTRSDLQGSVRRLQGALSDLGLYSGPVDGLIGPTTVEGFDRYRARFGPPDGDLLTTYSLAAIEETAVDGFADGQTRSLARSRGFHDAASYQEASSAGFGSAAEFTDARRRGFRDRGEFEAARAGGFADQETYRRAQAGGFRSADAMRIAERAGFTEAAEFESFKISGFDEVATFRRARSEGYSDRRSYEQGLAERLAAARADGEALRADVDAYLRLNPRTPQILAIAAEVATLSGALTGANDTAITASQVRLESILREIEPFSGFREGRERERVALVEAERAMLQGELRTFQTSLTRWTAANLTSDLLASVVAELKLLEQDIASEDVAVLRTARERVATLIEREGLSDAVTVLLDGDAAPSPSSPSSGVTAQVTDANRFLLEGDRDDVLVLYNSSPDAPALTRNLVGDFLFRSGRLASVCQHGVETTAPMRRALESEVVRLEAEGLELGQETCGEEDVSRRDVLLIKRRTFLEADTAFVIAVLEAIEARSLLPFDAMPFRAVERRMDREVALAASIAVGVRTDQRTGFGALALVTESGGLCVDDALDRDLHRDALEQIESYARSESVRLTGTTFDGLETVFDRSRAGKCAYVYGSHGALKQVADALERDGRPVSFVPFWLAEAEVDALRASNAATLEQAQRAEEDRRREQDAAETVASQAELERAATREVRQAELRSEHGAKAAAISNLYADGLRASLLGAESAVQGDRGNTGSALVLDLFPEFMAWSQQVSSEDWKASDVGVEISDYGLSDWRGRSLETVIVEVKTRLVSRTRGEYRTACHRLAAVFDGEFAVHRDPFEAVCDDDAGLSRWKAGHSMRSLWIAE